MDYGVVAVYVVLLLLFLAYFSRKAIGAWWQRRRAKVPAAPVTVDLGKLADRLDRKSVV